MSWTHDLDQAFKVRTKSVKQCTDGDASGRISKGPESFLKQRDVNKYPNLQVRELTNGRNIDLTTISIHASDKSAKRRQAPSR